MAENQIKDKLEQVMAAETNSLLAKAEYDSQNESGKPPLALLASR